MKKALVYMSDTVRERMHSAFDGWDAIVYNEPLGPDVKFDLIVATAEPVTQNITRGWNYLKKLEQVHLTPTGRLVFFD